MEDSKFLASNLEEKFFKNKWTTDSLSPSIKTYYGRKLENFLHKNFSKIFQRGTPYEIFTKIFIRP